MSHKHSSEHSSKSFTNGSCLRTGIPESDTGDSGEESEPTYRHYDNFETDVCLTQDEDDEPLGSSSPVIKLKEIGARLKNGNLPEPPKKDVIIREGREPIPRDDFTVPANNRSASSDTDTETELVKVNGGHGTDGTITTSTSESEETQIWVPVSKRPSARNAQDNTTPTGSSNGSEGSRPQSLVQKAGTSGHGHNFSTGSLTFVTSPPASQFDRASVTTGTLEDRRGSKDSWQTFKSRMKKSASPPKHLSLGLLRHDDRMGTITLDIRNMPPNSESGVGQFQSENDQFTSENENGATHQGRNPKYMMEESANSFTDNLCITCSLIYMLLITVTGLLIPIAELFVSEATPALFEGFYVYLHVLSILFLGYVYAYLLGIRTSLFQRGTRTILSPLTRGRSHVTDDIDTQHTGSFYLRIGVVGFGIGSMIKSGLHFGEFFGVTSSSYCSHVLYAIRPIFHLCFTFIQLYFVFLSSNMLIHKYKRIARFGLMHMIATNMCVWFENVVKETLRELSLTNITNVFNTSFGQVETKNSFHVHPEADCLDDSLMSEVVNTSFPYLFPCIVLYSLICASILYTMWSRLGESVKRSPNKIKDSFRRSGTSGVDCSGSSKGMFLGIIIFVAIVIILITQFVLNRAEGFQKVALRLEHIGDIAIFTITTIAVCLSFNRARGLRRYKDQRNTFEEMLLVLSLLGVYGFCVANIIAGANTDATSDGRLIITSNCVHLVQVSVQTVFLLGNVHKHAVKREIQNEKPGREFVTFLLVCNVAIFVMGLFKSQQANVNLVQTRFYGSVTWNVITHVTVPIKIFFRFQSSVCLANIWKYAWRSTQSNE